MEQSLIDQIPSPDTFKKNLEIEKQKNLINEIMQGLKKDPTNKYRKYTSNGSGHSEETRESVLGEFRTRGWLVYKSIGPPNYCVTDEEIAPEEVASDEYWKYKLTEKGWRDIA